MKLQGVLGYFDHYIFIKEFQFLGLKVFWGVFQFSFFFTDFGVSTMFVYVPFFFSLTRERIDILGFYFFWGISAERVIFIQLHDPYRAAASDEFRSHIRWQFRAGFPPNQAHGPERGNRPCWAATEQGWARVVWWRISLSAAALGEGGGWNLLAAEFQLNCAAGWLSPAGTCGPPVTCPKVWKQERAFFGVS